MTYIIPAWELDNGIKSNFRSAAQKIAIERALAHRVVADIDALTVRDILPEDLMLSFWTTCKEQGWQTWCDLVIPSNKFIVFTKFVQNSFLPRALELDITCGGSCVGKFPLEACYAGLPSLGALVRLCMDPETRQVIERLEGRGNETPMPSVFGQHAEGYFNEPYVFDENAQLTIKVKYAPGESVDNLILCGFVVEPQGVTTMRR